MSLAVLALALQQATAADSPAEVRTVTFSITDEKGAPVTGLLADEVALLENGAARGVSRLERETRPLMVAVIVDSSEPIATLYRLNVVDAVTRFLARLPEGSRYTLWTTGDRPTKVLELTDDASLAGKALKRVFPRGGNTLLDALVEASSDLKQKEGERTAVVVVSGNGLGFTNFDRFQVVERALKNAHRFMVVNFQEGAAPGDPVLGSNDAMGRVGRADYDYVLGALADRSGGLRETPLSSMGVQRSLEKVAAALGGQYRITYATLPDLKDRKLEVKVARPGVKVVVGASQP